jgi:hypothetical protein
MPLRAWRSCFWVFFVGVMGAGCPYLKMDEKEENWWWVDFLGDKFSK